MRREKEDLSILTRQEPLILENGKVDSVMDKENKFGWMEHATMGAGRTTGRMDMESSLISMEMSMKETGSMTKQTVMGFMSM